MANNIKIVGNIISTTTVSRYSEDDIKLIPSKKLQENFGGTGDYIEYYVYDIGGNLLNINYNYLSYKLPTDFGLTPGTSTPPNTRGRIQTTNIGIDSTLATPTSSLYPIIEIDPVQDLQDLGYSSGEFVTKYFLFQNKISDFANEALFIKEISPDRTELRLASTILTNEQIESGSLELINEINKADYYVDYLLNFGNNEQVVAVNVALNKAPEGYEILFKLYQPLLLNIVEKTTLWVVEEKVSPYNFDINLDKLIIPAPGPTLRGPNFDIEIPNSSTVSSQYNTYGNLVSSLQSLQNSSYQQILNLLATQSVDINIDYSNYDNFVFFGSAKQRLINFYNKVKEIEDYNTLITTYTPLTSSRPSLITEINKYSSSINTIVTQFDGFEYYLYFESGSTLTSSLDYSITPYPKSGSLKPFTLLSTGSVSASVWFNWATGSAKDYDLNNYDNLEYAIPTFVKDDANNQPFLTFLNMVGQYFDNIWIYLNSITDINLANNNLEVGISKDLVYERLKSLGVHLYNSQAGEDVNQYLIGANTGSSAWDNNTTITGSYLNNIPRKDLVSELYKRIYHNLPLLAKTKGTVAGLDNLMTIFGIPNQTYYTVGSQSFYTPTGSAATASILNVKEFGGSLKSNLINGYNNDKVRIVSNTITGSVLSPLLSLQTFPTASSAFRDDDMNYIDISFSPETQMDTYVSGAIASNNPTWSLDDYIGDPRQLYSGSYPDLDAQRKLYFETGVPGFAPFTASLLDYNGFIRLIQYFDNALFKMLGDFVPERTSLSTGVTINSPVLERNKVAYANPTNSTTQSVYEAEYPAPSMSSTYGTFYNALSSSNNTMGWYDGELSGSTVDVYQYFTDNYNPYLQPTGTIDQNAFAHSDWNVLLNNVSKSVVSNVRQKIEYTGNFLPTSSITSSAELQDSYLTLRSYNTSRYEGSKTTSLLYNTYTSGSYTGSDGFTIVTGDKSFGKTAAIDRKSYKIGWVKNIPSQSLNFPDKTTINLKYLVDKDSNLLELSYANLNLPEVQNTFKSGTPVVVSLSDVRKPSNQVSLDGTKTIFKGGYLYDPIIARENNEILYFKFDTPYSSSTSSPGIKVQDSNRFIYVKGSTTADPTFPPQSNTYNYFINGTQIQDKPMSYINYTSNWRYNLPGSFPNNLTWVGVNFTSWWGPTSTPSLPSIATTNVWGFDLLKFDTLLSYTDSTIPSSDVYSSDGTYIYKVPRTSTYNLKGNIPVQLEFIDPYVSPVSFKMVGIVEYNDINNINNDNSWKFVACTQLSPNGPTYGQPSVLQGRYNQVLVDGSTYNNTNNYNCTLNSTVTLNAGDYIRFRFYIIDFTNTFNRSTVGTYFRLVLNGYTVKENKAYFEIKDATTTLTEYFDISAYNSVAPFFAATSSNSIVFNKSTIPYFYSSSVFQLSEITQQYYSPIVDYFSVQPYDLLRVGSFNSPTVKYYEIANVSSVTRAPVSFPGGNFNVIPNYYGPNTTRQYFIYTPGVTQAAATASLFNIGDIVTISNTTSNNVTASIIGTTVSTLGDITLEFLSNITIETGTTPIFSFPYTQTIATFTSNIPDTGSFNSGSSQNFAILRPKANETSVIINYKKKPGDVSQTVLIPYDANDEIKNSVGNIYKTINPSIS